MNLKYLVTGTGRSGTVFSARLLTSAGIDCGHEMFFNVDGLNGYLDRLEGKLEPKLSEVSITRLENDHLIPIDFWLKNKPESDSSYMSAPFLDHETLINTKIIHLVRNPIKVVNSFVNSLNYFSENYNHYNDVYQKNIKQIIPELNKNMSQIERACLYYVMWNELIETKLKYKKYLFHRIEDDMQPILDYIGYKDDRRILFADKEINTFMKQGLNKFSLSQLPEGEIKNRFIDIGIKYGYKMSLDHLFI